MKKRFFVSVLVATILILSVVSVCLAGIDPSPFEPEINKLHSIELQMAAINKRLAKVNDSATLPEGVSNYLSAMTNQTQLLKAKLDEVLLVLPAPSQEGAYIGQDEAVFALDSIRIDSKDSFGIMESIVSRMGVGPSPFLPLFRNISINIVDGINFHILPVRPPLPLPQLPPMP